MNSQELILRDLNGCSHHDEETEITLKDEHLRYPGRKYWHNKAFKHRFDGRFYSILVTQRLKELI